MSIDLERIQKDEVKLSDDISKLETEKEKVAKKIELIDQTLQEFSDKIVELEKPIENRNDEQAKNKYDMRKPCKFNNRGYCSQKERCQFFHAETVCDIYRETGHCWKPICREDPPKLVGIAESVLEENHVDIYIMNYLVKNAKSVQPSDIIANFATKISVKDVQLMKHILKTSIQTMKILSVQISTMRRFGLQKDCVVHASRVMVSGASLGIGVFQWLCWGLIDGFKLFISLFGVLNK